MAQWYKKSLTAGGERLEPCKCFFCKNSGECGDKKFSTSKTANHTKITAKILRKFTVFTAFIAKRYGCFAVKIIFTAVHRNSYIIFSTKPRPGNWTDARKKFACLSTISVPLKFDHCYFDTGLKWFLINCFYIKTVSQNHSNKVWSTSYRNAVWKCNEKKVHNKNFIKCTQIIKTHKNMK